MDNPTLFGGAALRWPPRPVPAVQQPKPKPEPIIIPTPPANTNRVRFEIKGEVTRHPELRPQDEWNGMVSEVAAFDLGSCFQFLPIIADTVALALTDRDDRLVTQRLLFLLALTTRLLHDLGELPE